MELSAKFNKINTETAVSDGTILDVTVKDTSEKHNLFDTIQTTEKNRFSKLEHAKKTLKDKIIEIIERNEFTEIENKSDLLYQLEKEMNLEQKICVFKELIDLIGEQPKLNKLMQATMNGSENSNFNMFQSAQEGQKCHDATITSDDQQICAIVEIPSGENYDDLNKIFETRNVLTNNIFDQFLRNNEFTSNECVKLPLNIYEEIFKSIQEASTNFNILEKIIMDHRSELIFLVNLIRKMDPGIFQGDFSRSDLIYDDRVALDNSTDGNCLYNSCSQILFGNEDFNFLFRIAGLFILFEYYDYFENLLHRAYSLNNNKRLALTLATDKEWGDETCILILSILVNRPIWCFTHESNHSIVNEFCVNKKQSEREPLTIGLQSNHFYALAKVKKKVGINLTIQKRNEFEAFSLFTIKSYEDMDSDNDNTLIASNYERENNSENNNYVEQIRNNGEKIDEKARNRYNSIKETITTDDVLEELPTSANLTARLKYYFPYCQFDSNTDPKTVKINVDSDVCSNNKSKEMSVCEKNSEISFVKNTKCGSLLIGDNRDEFIVGDLLDEQVLLQ